MASNLPSAPLTASTLPSAPLTYLAPSQNGGTDFEFYQTSVQNLYSGATAQDDQAANPAQQSVLQITAAWDFYWCATTYKADLATAGADPEESTNLMPRVLVSIQDSSAQRLITPAPVPLDSIAGPGERPYRFIIPRLCRATTNLNFTWQAYGVVSDAFYYNYIYLILHGFVVPAGQPYPF